MAYVTHIKKVNPDLDYKKLLNNKVINEGAELLKKGEVVAFPTETVYGLGAEANNSEAVKKIFSVKGRPADNPLIVHIADQKQLEKVVQGAEVPELNKLFSAFWPGPLTVIFQRQKVIPDITTAGLDTVAVRMPSHRVARALIARASFPLAAPSANISGGPSPTRAEHVYRDLKGKLSLIIDGGPCEVGVESTVLDLSGSGPEILRPGAITGHDISAVLGKPVPSSRQAEDNRAMTPPAPGMKYRHYSPAAPVILVHNCQPDNLKNYIHSRKPKEPGLIVSTETAQKIRGRGFFENFKIAEMGSIKDLSQAAHNLFACLRNMDYEGVDYIIVEAVPEKGIGRAVMNRLYKAAEEEVFLEQFDKKEGDR